MPVMSSINNRIHAYEQKLQEWKEVERKAALIVLPQDKVNKIDECRSQLQHLLLEYNALQKQLQQEKRVEAAQLLAGDSLLQLNQQDIDYLESGCVKFLAELKTVAQPAAAAPADPQIKAAFEAGNYDQVINLYAQSGAMPGQIPAAETTFQYGQALLKNHQEAEARKVLGELLARIRQQKGQDELLLQSMQTFADLNFGLEAYPEAKQQYEELVRLSIEKGARKEEWAGLQLAALEPGGSTLPELKGYSALLRNYLAYVPKRDGYSVAEQADKFLLAYPSSRLVANAGIINRNTKGQAEATVNQGVKRIEDQASERKVQETPIVGGSSLPSGTSQPGGTLKAGDSQAVVAPQSPAGNEIQEAARLGAQDLRQKAAELFVRATNSRDSEEKRKLLLSSRDLLQSILVKYPQSGLTDKVQRNLTRIDAELRAIDASAAPKPVTSGGAYVPSKPGAGVPANSL